MKIVKIERYKIEGKEFRSLCDAKTYIEDEIGKILDKTPLRMDAKQSLDVFDAIVRNKSRLRELLSVETEIGGDETQGEIVNILDV